MKDWKGKLIVLLFGGALLAAAVSPALLLPGCTQKPAQEMSKQLLITDSEVLIENLNVTVIKKNDSQQSSTKSEVDAALEGHLQ